MGPETLNKHGDCGKSTYSLKIELNLLTGYKPYVQHTHRVSGCYLFSFAPFADLSALKEQFTFLKVRLLPRA